MRPNSYDLCYLRQGSATAKELVLEIQMIKQNSKAIGAGLGAAIGTIIGWGLKQIPGFEDLPVEVEGAITVLVATLITWFFPANEVPHQVNRKV